MHEADSFKTQDMVGMCIVLHFSPQYCGIRIAAATVLGAIEYDDKVRLRVSFPETHEWRVTAIDLIALPTKVGDKVPCTLWLNRFPFPLSWIAGEGVVKAQLEIRTES